MAHAKLLAFKIVLVALNLIVAALTVTSLVTVVNQGIQIELPGEDDINWTLDGDRIFFTTYVDITNEGYYPIQDLSIDIWLENSTGYRIIDQPVTVSRIESGTSIRQPIEVPLDLAQLEADGADYLIFEEDTLHIWADVNAFYTLGLIKFLADYDLEMPWSPLLGDVAIDKNGIQVTYDNGSFRIGVPYSIESNSPLSADIDVDITVSNSTGAMATNSTTVTLGQSTDDMVYFDLSPDATEHLVKHNETLTIEIAAGVGESASFSTEETYEWERLLGDVRVDSENADILYDGANITLTLPYIIETGGIYSGTVDADVLLYNNGTNLISQDGTSFALGTTDTGVLGFDLTEEVSRDLIVRSQPLLVVAEATVVGLGTTVTEEFPHHWEAPLANLSVSDPAEYINGTDTVISTLFNFTNESPEDLDGEVEASLLTDIGTTIGTETIQIPLPSGESYDGLINVTSDLDLVQGDKYTLKLKFKDKDTGMVYKVDKEFHGGA